VVGGIGTIELSGHVGRGIADEAARKQLEAKLSKRLLLGSGIPVKRSAADPMPAVRAGCFGFVSDELVEEKFAARLD